MKREKVILTKNELEVFSNELLSDFQMIKNYAGGAVVNDCGTFVSPDADGCNKNCSCGHTNFFWCGDTCLVKAWFTCH